ncbi:MAG: hypothetical protein IPH07_00345 [Deltaproteobacteria bacterium]|nr:hypothetical protein [Deltaproteobacteria bacterium]MBK8717378.1 hypothetical protein [Deltaproteobacteria bacterium]MBP7286243.1 hypothetical protein [Nannocystaceae bacterium]
MTWRGQAGVRRVLAAACVMVACATDQREEPSSATLTVTLGPEVTSEPSSEGGSEAATEAQTSAADSGGEKLDVGGGTGMMEGGDTTLGCKKVDLLFVVDGSGSMADEQANLLTAFPAFIDTMRTELDGAEGYNVGVIRTDGNDISCEPGRYGVLVTRNYAAGSSNTTCTPYASGARYMTQDDDLPSKFSCAARVGIGGDGDEQPMQSIIAALTPPNTDAGECNDGFLREDALLVLVIITDEEDDHETMEEACGNTPSMGSAGEPQDWFDAIVAAKGGIETNVVVLSLVGTAAPEQCPPLDKCDNGVDGAEQAPRLIGFTWMFSHGHVGPVCGDYQPFFLEAVADIKAACEEFVPPG